MATTFNKNGISEGNIIEPSHITQSYDAFTAQTSYDITLSGSLTLTGSVASFNGFTGSFSGSLDGDFLGYDINTSLTQIKIGFILINVNYNTVNQTYITSFPCNNILNVIFTPFGPITPGFPNGVDFFPFLSSFYNNIFTVSSSNTSATYTTPVAYMTTIFYN